MGGDPVAQPQVGVGVEDHLGDGEARPGVGLADEHLDVVVEVGAVGVDVGEGRDADGEVPEPADERGRAGRRGPGPRGAASTDPARCRAGRRAARGCCAPPTRRTGPTTWRTWRTEAPDAGEVGERGQRGLVGDPPGDPDGAVLGGAARAVGDRHEGRPDPLELADGGPQLGLGVVVLGGEELEADRGPVLAEPGRDRRDEVLGASASSVVGHGGEGSRGPTP